MPNAAVVNSLALEIKRKGDVAVVHCRGRLVAGTTDVLCVKVRELIPECKRIVLDLTELSHVDSMGLGTLVRLCVSARSAGSRLELINLGKQVRELLGLTNLLSLFTDMCEQGVTVRF